MRVSSRGGGHNATWSCARLKHHRRPTKRACESCAEAFTGVARSPAADYVARADAQATCTLDDAAGATCGSADAQAVQPQLTCHDRAMTDKNRSCLRPRLSCWHDIPAHSSRSAVIKMCERPSRHGLYCTAVTAKTELGSPPFTRLLKRTWKYRLTGPGSLPHRGAARTSDSINCSAPSCERHRNA